MEDFANVINNYIRLCQKKGNLMEHQLDRLARMLNERNKAYKAYKALGQLFEVSRHATNDELDADEFFNNIHN